MTALSTIRSRLVIYSFHVTRFLKSEIGATVGWMLGSFLLAAAISPWIYQTGMQLAASAEKNDLPALLEWLGAACGRSKLGRYFARSLLLSALLLLPFLLRRIRTLRSNSGAPPLEVVRRTSWKYAAAQIGVGCVIAAGLLLALGGVLEIAGLYAPSAHTPSAGRLFSKVLVPAVVASPLEEWLFRGVLLGLWLRFTRPAAACVGTSLMFAFIHFFRPASNSVTLAPDHALAGFELLGRICLHFTEPLSFLTDFATLFVVGLILAWARVRTGALWFPIGLHAGWILAFKGFNQFNQQVPGHFLQPWGVGESLRSGLLPLLMLGVTAVVCHFAMRRFPAEKPRGF